MSGAFDRQYIVARGVLLDALEALGLQRKAVILVGAQAIYLYTGAIELAVAEFTTDADITLDPSRLDPVPEIESAMIAGGFHRGKRVGSWGVFRDISGVPTNVEVDLMVPEAVGGPGSRAARLVGHAKHVAQKARGLEAALIDQNMTTISALDETDKRAFPVAVAGPTALMVSKLHKIQERLAELEQRRLNAKDALDVLRLLRAIPTHDLASMFVKLLDTEVSKAVSREALIVLKDLFSTPRGIGSQMAVRAAGPLANADEIAGSCSILASDLLKAVPG
ncbi:MAG TPA: GSU2403 family nucleotidyltransferase fold protein [Bryobacteraceae bacterium]|nr:GSU2403 family nucleotidyltransferase fold protein [Bryobacteraceae bacterium]